MRFNPDVYDAEVEREFKRFFKWTGEEVWRKKTAKLKQLPRLSYVDAYREYLHNRNPLTVCIEQYFDLSQQGKLVARHLNNEIKKACGYIKLLNCIAHELSDGGLKRLRGNIADDESIKGFLFEIDIAIHFLKLGYDVRFIDLDGAGNYDLLVSDDKFEVEIECKRKSMDAGRKIRKGDFYLLADTLFGSLKDLRSRFAVLITSEGRMGADPSLYKLLANTINEVLVAGGNRAKVENLKITIQPLPADRQIKTADEFANALAPFDSSFAYYAVTSGPEHTMIIRCASADSNKVLDAIYDDLKKGASQLTGTRPSLVSCFIEEIEDESWDLLRSGSGLPSLAARLLSSPSRGHVNLVAFSSDLTPPKEEGNTISFAATNLAFSNPDPKFLLPPSFLSRPA
ncbi:MAG: hypothetical protein WD688_15935 [Candidatus Binatia bacterium]